MSVAVVDPQEAVTLIGIPGFDPTRDRVQLAVPPGTSLAEMVGHALPELPASLLEHVRVTIGAEVVPQPLWARVKPKPATVVTIRVIPQGGNALRMVAMVAVVVAASYFAAPLAFGAASAMGAGWTTAGGTFIASAGFMSIATPVIGAGITMAGALLVNALIPVRPPSLGGMRSPSPSYSVDAPRNQVNRWGPVPVVHGRNRVAPFYAAEPYSELVGQDYYVRALFIWGLGEYDISDLRLGDTPLSEFEDVEVETNTGAPDDETALTLYPGAGFEEPGLNVQIWKGAENALVRTTAADVDEFTVSVTAPTGIIRISNNGKNKTSREYWIDIEYRLAGSGGPWQWGGEIHAKGKTHDPLRFGQRVVLPQRGTYEVRLSRIRGDGDTGARHRIFNDSFWTGLQSFRAGNPISLGDTPYAWTAIRIRATDQLSGPLENFNGIAQSVSPSFGNGLDKAVTRNPADCFLATLEGPGNARPRRRDQIDMQALEDWWTYCDARGLTYDRIHDFGGSVYEALADIAAAGHAAPSFRAGKWSVVMDTPTNTVVGHLTPRNSSGFTGQRIYQQLPDLLRVRFIDATNGYRQAERLVVRRSLLPPELDLTQHSDQDLVEMAEATLGEGIEFPGITDPDLIWREAQRRFAEMESRPDRYQLTQDWESLLHVRGDRVRVSHDIIDRQVGWGRVRQTIEEGGVQRVVLDDAVTMEEGEQYAVRFRLANASDLLRLVVTEPGETNVLTLEGEGPLPATDNLASFGIRGRETREMVVTNIQRMEEFGATLSLVDVAPRMDTAWEETPPSWTQQGQASDGRPAVPRIIAVHSGDSTAELQEDGTLVMPVIVSWTAGSGMGVAPSANYTLRHRLKDGSAWRRVLSDQTSLRLEGYKPGDVIELQVRATSTAGFSSDWTEVWEHTVEDVTRRPPNVGTFTVSELENGLRRFEWELEPPDDVVDPSDLDAPPNLAGYRIRAAEGSGLDWEDLDPLYEGLLTMDRWDTVQPIEAGTYTFGIVAVDTSGRESETPKLITQTLDRSLVDLEGDIGDLIGAVDDLSLDLIALASATSALTGAATITEDFDAIEKSGFYMNEVVAATGAPDPTLNYITVFHIEKESGFAHQVALRQDPANLQVWVRARGGTDVLDPPTWGAWAELAFAP